MVSPNCMSRAWPTLQHQWSQRRTATQISQVKPSRMCKGVNHLINVNQTHSKKWTCNLSDFANWWLLQLPSGIRTWSVNSFSSSDVSSWGREASFAASWLLILAVKKSPGIKMETLFNQQQSASSPWPIHQEAWNNMMEAGQNLDVEYTNSVWFFGGNINSH